jgi:hypothetical protein
LLAGVQWYTEQAQERRAVLSTMEENRVAIRSDVDNVERNLAHLWIEGLSEEERASLVSGPRPGGKALQVCIRCARRPHACICLRGPKTREETALERDLRREQTADKPGARKESGGKRKRKRKDTRKEIIGEFAAHLIERAEKPRGADDVYQQLAVDLIDRPRDGTERAAMEYEAHAPLPEARPDAQPSLCVPTAQEAQSAREALKARMLSIRERAKRSHRWERRADEMSNGERDTLIALLLLSAGRPIWQALLSIGG